MAETLANKHRPRKPSEIIGQPSVVTTLRNSVEFGNLHHAYLFYGSFGTGKTSMSRVLAAMINCEKGPTTEPCGNCVQCKTIFAGKNSDVVEMDAASGGKVDEIRELKRTVFYAPVSGARKKVYIIDECLPYSAKIKLQDENEEKEISIGELVESELSADNFEKVVDIDREKILVKGADTQSGDTVFQPIKRYIKIPNDKQMYELDVKDELGNIKTIKVTGNHKIYSNGQYIKVEDLKIGNSVIVAGELRNFVNDR